MKEHKMQIIAALALAFSLGIAMPAFTYASEGDENAEVATQAETAAGVNDESVAASPDILSELVTIVANDEDYTKYKTLSDALAVFPATGEPTAAQLKTAQDAVKAIKSDAVDSEMDTAAKVKAVAEGLADYSQWTTVLGVLSTVSTKTGVTLDKVTAALIKEKMTEAEIKDSCAKLLRYFSDETLNLVDSAQLLYNRIENWESFKEYRDSRTLVGMVVDSEYLFETVEKFLSNKTDSIDKEAYWTRLSEGSKAQMKGKLGYEAFPSIADLPEYKSDAGFKDFVDGQYQSGLENFIATFREEIPKVLPEETGVSTMGFVDLVKTAHKLKNFDKYYALLKADTPFILAAVDNGAFSTTKFKALDLKTQTELYSAVAAAAAAIDPNVTMGLAAYELPKTSAPTTPDAGIVGLFENGALDLGTITLIVSVALASVAGLSLIAKLYLKHKF